MITLKEVLSIPSYSGEETMVIDYIINFCDTNGFNYYSDIKKNIYITKGLVSEGEYYPCVIAHMDTVHSDQLSLIRDKQNINIDESIRNGKTMLTGHHPIYNKITGIGGDNKCGIFIALNLLLTTTTIKVAFFVEEEIGMKGSSVCDESFFKDVGYAMQFDAPTNNWFSKTCTGIKLWTDEMFEDVKPILEKYGIDNISTDPFTDVVQMRKKFDFCCMVLCSGYYQQHTKYEYVIKEDVINSIKMGGEIIEKLGRKKYVI